MKNFLMATGIIVVITAIIISAVSGKFLGFINWTAIFGSPNDVSLVGNNNDGDDNSPGVSETPAQTLPSEMQDWPIMRSNDEATLSRTIETSREEVANEDFSAHITPVIDLGRLADSELRNLGLQEGIWMFSLEANALGSNSGVVANILSLNVTENLDEGTNFISFSPELYVATTSLENDETVFCYRAQESFSVSAAGTSLTLYGFAIEDQYFRTAEFGLVSPPELFETAKRLVSAITVAGVPVERLTTLPNNDIYVTSWPWNTVHGSAQANDAIKNESVISTIRNKVQSEISGNNDVLVIIGQIRLPETIGLTPIASDTLDLTRHGFTPAEGVELDPFVYSIYEIDRGELYFAVNGFKYIDMAPEVDTPES